MKISLLIAAIIIGVASIFGVQQRKKIKTLTTEWEDIQERATARKISTNPKAAFSSQRVRSDNARAAREQKVKDFAAELSAFAKKMKEAEESGGVNQDDMQKEVIALLETFTSLTPDELKYLVRLMADDTSIDENTKKELVSMSIMMLSSDNPRAALAIISESSEVLGLNRRGVQMVSMALAQLANQDPEAAANWINDNEELLGDKLDDTKNGMLVMAAQKDLNAAISMMGILKIEEAAEAFAGLARGVKAGDQENFLNALRARKFSEQEQLKAFKSLGGSPLFKDFETATRWLDEGDLSAEERDAITSGLYYHNVKEAPKEWLGWISEQETQNDATAQATQKILRGWAQDNFVEAGEWLQKQDEGENKNAAIKTYAQTLAPHEPAAAAEWAESLPPGEERTQLFQTIHFSLKEQDPAAAAALAEKHQLKVASENKD